MISLLYALFIGVAIIGGILLARRLRGQRSDGYRRRFSDHRNQIDPTQYPPTIFAAGMDSAGHHHPQHHSPDCSTHTDSGGGCADGGGGN